MSVWRWIFSSFRLGKLPSLALFPAVEHTLASLLNLIFPDDCRVCNTPLTNFSRIPVCAGCLSEPEPFEPEFFCVSCGTPFANSYPLDAEGHCGLCRRGLAGFDAAYAYGSYEGKLREMVHLFKYGRVRTLAKPLAALMVRALPSAQRFDIVAPMPMHWLRRWRRGFNQAELLAGEVARRHGLPVSHPVRRSRATPSQAGQSRSARRLNVAGAFELRKAPEVRGCRVLLVDDVLTTGATASACAAALKRGGAKYVAVLTLARADRRRLFPPGLLSPAATRSQRSQMDA